ncbi:helix-turn-helix domain-containing protein [Caulobacter sp. RL271]|uniref:Helix-turn-helix domain-containing protein n=1 Tax=Caulobacter segnis TaxID=88688 RepID=A0ABY4ZRX4_9CAUL|nr:helix-turn-helix domain-containing protein [Caulobacter segnis]USQ95260.1 helix-turn-helix domain-containing protein [Caulobacter segnis]
MMDEDDAINRAARARKGSPFLNTAQAAHYIGLAERTLEDMRAHGQGPAFRRHGRFIRYHIDDLDTWSQRSGERRNGAGEARHV